MRAFPKFKTYVLHKEDHKVRNLNFFSFPNPSPKNTNQADNSCLCFQFKVHPL